MKKYLFIFLMLSFGVVNGQVDTTSIFIKNLPSVVKTDSNFVLISESPFTTFKTTWKNLQRSFNFRQLKQTQKAYMSDIIAITHKNTFDTTKGIKVSDFYKTALKDSVKGELGIAMTSIISEIESSDSLLTAQLELKASIESVDNVLQRLSLAETEILQKAGIVKLNEVRDSLFSEINLKANVSRVDSLTGRMSSAETAIEQKATLTELSNGLQNLLSEINLKADVASVDTLTGMLQSAQTLISQKASLTDLEGIYDSLYSQIELKANVSQLNVVDSTLNNAFAQITIEANSRRAGDSTLTAQIALKVGVNDVYSLLQILPDEIKIQSKNIILDGDVLAGAISGKDIDVNMMTSRGIDVTEGSSRITVTPTGISHSYNLGNGWESESVAFQGWSLANFNTNLGITSIGSGLTLTNGVLSSQGGFSGSYNDLTNKPTSFTPTTHGNEKHSESYITASALGGYATTTSLNNYVTNTTFSSTLANYVTGENFGALNTRVTGLELSGFLTSVPGEFINETELNTALNGKANSSHPHSEYLTSIPSEYITESELSANNFVNISQVEHWFSNSLDGATKSWVNAQGFLKSFTETDPTISTWAKATTKPNYAYSEITSKPTLFSGSYTDLTNKPTIPSASVGNTDAYVRTMFGNEYMIYTQTISLNGTSLTFITNISEF